MKLNRRDTERPRPSRVPSFLGHRRRRTLDTESICEPLISLSGSVPRSRETELLRLRFNDPGLWRLPRRKRRISITTAEDQNSAEKQGATDDQSQSFLFRLPKDVRSRVYEYVLGNRDLHIVRGHAKLGHKSCGTDGSPEACLFSQCRGSKTTYGIYRDSGDGGLIQLLQTCRKIYTEAISIIYSHNTFDFDSMETFLAFSCGVLPSRFDNIHSIQLDFQFSIATHFGESHPEIDMPRWERTWRVIATMKALQEVRVRIDWPRGVASGKEITPEKEIEFLEPLMLVKGLRVFEVLLPRLENSGSKIIVGAIFCVRRCEGWHMDLLQLAETDLGLVTVSTASSWRT